MLGSSTQLPFHTLYCSYSIISSLFDQFGLKIEYNKSEVFHFSRLTTKIEPLLLDLRPVGNSLFKPKDMWWYLGFFFDKKLSFWHHIHYYANKVLSTIKDIKMLSNFIRGLSLVHKHLLYRTCVLSITLYRFWLWYFKGALLYYLLKELKKMQRRAVLWIIEAFHTLPSWEVISFHLNKLVGWHYFWVVSLPKQHALNYLVNSHHFKQTISYHMATSCHTFK